MLNGYILGDYLYAFGIALFYGLLLLQHRRGTLDLNYLITSTDKKGKTRVDGRKLGEVGAWYVMTLGLWYLVVHDKITEFYVLAYLGAFVTARFLRDREQRLNKQIDISAGKPA